MTTLNINQKLNGIELSFDIKPSVSILNALKGQGFRWHRVKHLWYAKQTPERLELAKSLIDGSTISTTLTRSKKEAVNKYGVQVGDVFVDSWGYEQTNIDFYQVVALKGSTQVVLAAINYTSKPNGFCSEMVKPMKDSFKTGSYITRLQHDGEKNITRTVKQCGTAIYAGSEYLSLTTWDTEHNQTSYY